MNGVVCANGGTCMNVIGSFNCTCSDGYTGPTCSEGMSTKVLTNSVETLNAYTYS